jgi:hypothetical protein
MTLEGALSFLRKKNEKPFSFREMLYMGTKFFNQEMDTKMI